jgi:hypothetical protein
MAKGATMSGEKDEFSCEMCGGTFPKAWSDEEAEAEYVRLFGGDPKKDDVAVICEVCFRGQP